jgi:predicted esterase
LNRLRGLVAAAIVAAPLGADARGGAPGADAILGFRFGVPPAAPPRQTGLRTLDGGAMLAVPDSYRPEAPAPLLVMLHGAGGTPEHALALVGRLAAKRGILVLAPKSAGLTWDIIARRAYGPDVAALDGMLAKVAREYSVDPERVAIGGFSDGASYALSLGLSNGALFRNIIAFSPGFVVAPKRIEGQPSIFLSHGTRDRVLPIDLCGRRLARELKRAGFSIRYAEFGGGHEVPVELAQEALDRLSGS